MEDKFKLYKKWFWIGIIVGFLNFIAGLIYGFAMVAEREHRKEGWIVVVWSVVSLLFTYWLTQVVLQ